MEVMAIRWKFTPKYRVEAANLVVKTGRWSCPQIVDTSVHAACG